MGTQNSNGDLAMSPIMIRCPKTGRPVSTGIEIEHGDFRRLPNVRARMRCPACGQEHVWRRSAAWLEREPRLVSPAQIEAA
jgi:hypothetical protein